MIDDTASIRDALEGIEEHFSISELYQENSKITKTNNRFALDREALDITSRGYKRYRFADRIVLPPENTITLSLADAIARRRSVRRCTAGLITAGDLSCLLALSCREQPEGRHRPAPSAGGLFPLETYVVPFCVSGVPVSLCHYDVRGHELEVLQYDLSRSAFEGTIFATDVPSTASVIIIISAMFGRSKIKYGERGYRFSLLEAGHVGQNVSLVASALGLGCCAIGGFVDDDINALLGLDGVDEAVLYIMSIGTRS